MRTWWRCASGCSRRHRRRSRGPEPGPSLLAELTAAVGLTAAVTSTGGWFLWKGVRIHLDDVEHLGTFIELEAVARPDSGLSHEHELISHLRTAFAITDERLVAIGYAKQLSNRISNPT
jgi:adenylate cyclase, class 2